MANYHIQLFGIAQVFVDGEVVQIRRRKALALFIYLLMNPTAQSRVRLSGLLWEADTQSKTNAYLRLLIHELKQVLGDDLLVDESRIEIAPDIDIWIDAVQFNQLVHESLANNVHDRIEHLNDALALYSDEFLLDLCLPDAPKFEVWLGLQRNRFHELLVQVYQELVDGYLMVGESRKGLDIGQRWLLREPHSEAAYYALMQLHYRMWRRSTALVYYQRLCDMLVREFSISPTPRTQALYNLIRRADLQDNVFSGVLDSILMQHIQHPNITIQRQQLLSDEEFHRLSENYPDLKSIQIDIRDDKAEIRLQSHQDGLVKEHNIPQNPAPFVGREREIEEISQAIGLAENRLVTLLGLGGIGKTRLAQELGVRQAEYFEHGVTFVALEHAQSEDDIFYAIADALELDIPHLRDAARESVLRQLKQGQRLLILDNYEHLVAYSPVVRHFLEESSQLNILVTSRERLNIEGEVIYPVHGMHYPDKGSSESLNDYESIRLFMERLRRVRPTKMINDDELREIAIICRLVQGVPLGIVIAAAWGNILPIKEIQYKIQRSLDFLQTEQRDMPARHRSIRAIFDTSWILLSDSERETLLRLAVFRGGFSQQAAAAVSNASLHTLNTIINKSLLTYDDVSGRFSLHPLIQQFTEEQLAKHEGEIIIRYAHSRYYLGLVHEFDDGQPQSNQDSMLRIVTAELENIRAAWYFAASVRDFELIDGAIGVMSLYHAIRGLWSEAFALFEGARKALAPRDGEKAHPTWGRLMSHHYGNTHQHGGVEQRLVFLRRGLDIVQAAGLGFETSHALMEIGVASILAERYEDAIVFIQQARDFHEQENLEHALAHSCWYLALCYTAIGHTEEAVQYNDRSYQLKLKLNDRRGISDCINMKATLAFALGDFDAVPQFLEEARAISQNIDNRTGVMFSSLALALYELLVGEWELAQHLASDALEIAQIVSNIDEGQAVGQALLGMLAYLRGEEGRAKELMLSAWSNLQEKEPESSTESVNLGMTFVINWTLSFLALSFSESEILEYCLPQIQEFALRTKSLGVQIICLPIMAVYFANKDVNRLQYFLALSNNLPEVGNWAKEWSRLQRLQSASDMPEVGVLSQEVLTKALDF